ncbi:hypothetical protein ACR82P_002484 [Yersinia enterocolitica]|nr:hypothetical protein [Yersinia enterocolitica]HDL7033293.1 hypothetical protein [Yersinia enterocolitica]
MARKKIWAYAYKDEKEYIRNETLEKERLFFIWEALKIRKDSPKEFPFLTFMSTQFNKDKRAELIPVKKSKTAFFRYKSESQVQNEPHDTDYELISHETAILVLSEMKIIKFQDGNKSYEIEFNKIKKDDLKIRFEDGETYYPDLMGFFSKPEELARKWGGKVAIEIKVTHKCSYEKIKDFQDHNIPIIEVSLSDKMRLKSEINDTDIDESDMEKYYHFLQDKFSKVVYMKILSNPVMLKEHNEIVSFNEKEIGRFKNEISQFKSTLTRTSSENESNKVIINRFTEEIPKIKKLINDKQCENEAILNELNKERSTIKELKKKVEILELESYNRLNFLQRLKRLF